MWLVFQRDIDKEVAAQLTSHSKERERGYPKMLLQGNNLENKSLKQNDIKIIKKFYYYQIRKEDRGNGLSHKEVFKIVPGNSLGI